MQEQYELTERKPKQKKVYKTLYTIINKKQIFVCTGSERQLKTITMLSRTRDPDRVYEIV